VPVSVSSCSDESMQTVPGSWSDRKMNVLQISDVCSAVAIDIKDRLIIFVVTKLLWASIFSGLPNFAKGLPAAHTL